MENKPIQDFYEDLASVCYGCGRLNDHGLHVQTYWNGEEGVATFQPQPYHLAMPGYVYGGLLASLVDCHSIGTAAAAVYEAEQRPPGSDPVLRYVTGSLHVDYLKPTPVDQTLTLRARAVEMRPGGRKVRVECSIYAGEVETVRGQVVAVLMPESWIARLRDQ